MGAHHSGATSKSKMAPYATRIPVGLSEMLKKLRERAKRLDAQLFERQVVATALYRYVKVASGDLDAIEALPVVMRTAPPQEP